jgi:tRNA nucleotidyltransferase (CCA-adding enzyme)
MQITSHEIPVYIVEISDKLIQNGFEAHLVGGSVRDLLLNKKPKDYDITTNATPDQIATIFPESILTGAKFGTVKVLVDNYDGEKEVVDVTTFRSEEDYYGGRWPSKVIFAKTITQDLERRDFTINAMAINLDNSNLEIIDPFGGQVDLEQKIIRAVGNPEERFNEDGLRPFRACRLASTLEFTIESNTFNAISKTISVAEKVSTERITVEFKRLLEESPKPSIGIELLRTSGLLKIFLPELLEGFEMYQNQYHTHDVYYHLLACADYAPKHIRLAALFHDIAKPRKKSGEHFYGHDIEGERLTKEIMNRLKFPRWEIDKTAKLVRWHMFYYPETSEEEAQRIIKENDPNYNNDIIEQERKSNRAQKLEEGWSDNAIRRFISKLGGDEFIDDLMELRIADAISTSKEDDFNPNEGGFKNFQERIANVREQNGAVKISDLNVNGNDLIALGIPEGPKVKEILKQLLEIVIDNPEFNVKEELLEIAKKLSSN